MTDKKEIIFKLEPVNENQIKRKERIKPVKIHKVIIPKITPVERINGYRLNKLSKKMEKVDETEINYLKGLKLEPMKADYIQEIYKRYKRRDIDNYVHPGNNEKFWKTLREERIIEPGMYKAICRLIKEKHLRDDDK